MLPSIYTNRKNLFKELSSNVIESKGKFAMYIKSKIFQQTKLFLQNNKNTNHNDNNNNSYANYSSTVSSSMTHINHDKQGHMKCTSIISNKVNVDKCHEGSLQIKCLKCGKKWHKNKCNSVDIIKRNRCDSNYKNDLDGKKENVVIKKMNTICVVKRNLTSEKKLLSTKISQECSEEMKWKNGKKVLKLLKKNNVIGDRFYKVLKLNQFIRGKQEYIGRNSSLLKAVTITSEKNHFYTNNNNNLIK